MGDKDQYGQSFKRARYDAATRLAAPELEDRATAAKKMGLTDAFLRKLESGEKRPGFDTLEAMAKVYNVLPGDLLPSMAPKGGEVDRIVAPLMMLPAGMRSRFIVQMEAFARIIAAELAEAVAESQDNSRIKPTVAYTPRSVNNEAVNEEPNAVVLAAMQGSITNSNVSEDSEDASSPRAGKRETTYRPSRSTEKKAKG